MNIPTWNEMVYMNNNMWCLCESCPTQCGSKNSSLGSFIGARISKNQKMKASFALNLIPNTITTGLYELGPQENMRFYSVVHINPVCFIAFIALAYYIPYKLVHILYLTP